MIEAKINRRRAIRLLAGGALAAATAFNLGLPQFTLPKLSAASAPNSVENDNILLQFSLGLNTGLAITTIRDKQTNFDYISTSGSASQPTSFFEFAVDKGRTYPNNDTAYPSDTGLAVSNVETNADGSLSFAATAIEVPLSFEIDASAPAGEPAAIIGIKAKNTSSKEFYLQLILPKLDGLHGIGQPDMW